MSNKIIINQADIDIVLDLRKKNHSLADIKKITNIPYFKISRICKDNKLTSINYLHGPDEAEVAKMQEMYDAGNTIKSIAETFDWDRHTVANYINTVDRVSKKQSTGKSGIFVIEWRQRLKRKAIEYKGGKCQLCGYSKSIRAMHFHHVDESEKDFSIGGNGSTRKWETIKLELDKCILVCANCHGEIHDGLVNIDHLKK